MRNQVISKAQGQPIIDAVEKANNVSAAITELQLAPGEWSTKAPQVQQLIDSLKPIVTDNLPSGEITVQLINAVQNMWTSINNIKEALK